MANFTYLLQKVRNSQHVKEEMFLQTVQGGSEVRPASHQKGIRGFFPRGAKWPGHEADYASAEECLDLYLHFTIHLRVVCRC
jgi:hypothetical protein